MTYSDGHENAAWVRRYLNEDGEAAPNLPNCNLPKTTVDCPECGGRRVHTARVGIAFDDVERDCDACDGSGQVVAEDPEA